MKEILFGVVEYYLYMYVGLDVGCKIPQYHFTDIKRFFILYYSLLLYMPTYILWTRSKRLAANLDVFVI